MTQEPATESGWNWRKPKVLLAAACLAGLGLRLLLLGSKSLWLDEALSLNAASASLAALWTGAVDPHHPPLYYSLLHYWLRLGTSESTLRLSSALIGAAAIPAVYALARQLAGTPVAIAAAWLTALSPLPVWYSQELRSYSLLTLLGLLAGLAVVRLGARPRAGWWLLLVASMTAALYTHYVAVLLPLVQGLLVAVLRVQGRLRRAGALLWLASLPVAALLYWPWLWRSAASVFWRSALSDRFYPVNLAATALHLPTGQATVLVVGALAAAVVAVILVAYVLVQQEPATWERWRRAPGVRMAFLLLVLAATVIAVIPRVYTIKKIVAALWPYGLLTAAWVWPWQPANRRTLALILAASLIGALINVSVVPKDQWRDVAAYLEEHRLPGDGLWLQPHYHAAALNYYTHGAITPVKPDVGGAPDALAAQAAGLSRLWYVYGVRDVGAADPHRVVAAWLDKNMRQVESREWSGIRLALYVAEE